MWCDDTPRRARECRWIWGKWQSVVTTHSLHVHQQQCRNLLYLPNSITVTKGKIFPESPFFYLNFASFFSLCLGRLIICICACVGAAAVSWYWNGKHARLTYTGLHRQDLSQYIYASVNDGASWILFVLLLFIIHSYSYFCSACASGAVAVSIAFM